MLTFGLASLAIVAAIAAIVLDLKRRASARALEETTRRKESIEVSFRQAEDRCRRLAKYEGCIDADAHAKVILAEATEKAGSLLAEAHKTAESALAEARARVEKTAAQATALQTAAQTEAERLRADARARADETVVQSTQLRATAEVEAERLRAQGRAALEAARVECSAIVAKAKQQAQEIAAEAKKTEDTTARLEHTAKAMKNIIEGYGDQYVVPTYGLLDELGDQFGFTDAGKKLQDAREKIRAMIRNGDAASCDYVEATRRETAIDFVLDAFNGKVATILADVRHDNHGTLQQKIRDAYSVVNNNGAAFRSARITPEYLDAQLDVLRWAVVVQELKLRDKEEQRAMREKIREEEKAQREFERAMREAEKEEGLLRKAMEKARAEVEKASDEQKAKYEAQLSALAEKLRLAEEKNQRALSMAQQTKAGHVYIISNVGSFGEDVHKIGLTRRLEPLDRIRELGDASVPFEFDVHAMVRSDDAPALESELHRLFVRNQVNKVNPRKEFFRASLSEIRAAVEKLGHETSWTMAARCAEYKETLAIERAMKDKTLTENEWMARQVRKQAELRYRSVTEQEEELDAVDVIPT
jgi:hypothetical protein